MYSEVQDSNEIHDVGFSLRKWTLNDVQALVRHANNKKIADNLRDIFPNPYTEQDAINFLTAATEENEKQCLFAIDIKGEAVGGIGISLQDDIHRKSAEIGYWLAEPYWARGIMTAAIRRMVDYAFKQYDLVRIFAEPFAYNTGSRRTLEKAGFQCEGTLRHSIYKNKRIYDSCIYGILKNES